MSLYIFDVDGTLAKGIDEQVMHPYMISYCKSLREAGHVIAIASNQGGVSLGGVTLEEALSRISRFAKTIEAADWVIATYHKHYRQRNLCGHHPDKHYSDLPEWRKPEPGMLLHLMNKLSFTANDTYYVGDRDVDRAAAEAAGVTFVWESEVSRNV